MGQTRRIAIGRVGRVPRFTWERMDEFNKGPSEYKRFSISIVSPYKWGEGWTAEEERSFYVELASKLSENKKLNGFSYDFPRDSSPSLRGKLFFDKTDIYMHPMEFSGYATDEVIGELLSVLQSMDEKNVQHAELSYKWEVSGMSDFEYKKLLIANVANIARWQDAMMEAGYSEYDLGNKFSEAFRVKRVGDGSALSSSNIEWAFVDDLWKIRKGLVDYEKGKDIENSTNVSLGDILGDMEESGLGR